MYMQKIKYIINNIDSTFKVARKFMLPYIGIRYIIGNYLYGHLFENEADGFRKLRKQDNLLTIDVGGNDGLFSRFLTSFISDSIVHIFEPVLLHSAKLNKLKSNNNQFFVHALACGAKKDEGFIHVPYITLLSKKLYLSAYSTISDRETDNFAELNHFASSFYFNNKIKIATQKINIRPLDSYSLAPDILKIDVEGLEELVVLGALQTINNSKPVIYVEQPSNTINDIMGEMGYKKYIFESTTQTFKEVQENKDKIYNYYYIYDTSVFHEDAFK